LFNVSVLQKNQNNRRQSLVENSGRPNIKAAVFKTSKKIKIDRLKEIIRKYTPDTQRIKGYVLLDNSTLASVQTVFDHIDIKISDEKTGNTALILMGEDFNLSKFSRDFRQLT